MKYPKVVKEPTTYYLVVIWRVGRPWNEAENKYYKTFEGACRAIRQANKYGTVEEANIRKEDVWYRDEENEYSSSGVVATYNAKTDEMVIKRFKEIA